MADSQQFSVGRGSWELGVRGWGRRELGVRSWGLGKRGIGS
uniref:Uncharacterized protein n=1 Tax=Desertifilum tharense IPPAS B-1220 TaxID=1781255 RepID=A0ACD5H2G9_9CYAN